MDGIKPTNGINEANKLNRNQLMKDWWILRTQKRRNIKE